MQTEPVDVYEKSVKELMSDYRSKTSRQKYALDKDYIKFKEGIWVTTSRHFRLPSLTRLLQGATHPDVPMPPMTNFIEMGKPCWSWRPSRLTALSEEGDDSDDEELEVGGITQSFKCALTLNDLVQPMRSCVVPSQFSSSTDQLPANSVVTPSPATHFATS